MRDSDKLKPYLKTYLEKHGVEFRGSQFKCLFHDDNQESAGIVPASGGTSAHCFTCGESWDIFDYAAHFNGLNVKQDFPKLIETVSNELGFFMNENISSRSENKPIEKPAEKPVTITPEAAAEIYKSEAILDVAKLIFTKDELIDGVKLEIEKKWACKNEDGNFEFIEVRFNPKCFKDNKKRIRAVWYNGKRLRTKNCPHGLFGRDLLIKNPDKPVLIVEGAKKYEAVAVSLPDFVPVTWNGGANGQKKIDFAPLAGRRVYIYPDDDEPGRKMAHTTAQMLAGIAAEVIIIEPYAPARKLKAKGADIVEALEVLNDNPDKIRILTDYILSHTPPEPVPQSNDPYIRAGLYLAQDGFYRIYDKKSIAFYSMKEEQLYNYGEIRDKYSEDTMRFKTGEKINPAKAAKMINNLDAVYPVYHLVKSYGYLPNYMGKVTNENRFIINRWKGFAHPKYNEPPELTADIQEQINLVKSHIKEILCGGIEEDYQYLCKWIAHIFQKPDVKPGTAVFAVSEAEGTGKSIIFEQLIPNMLGVENTSVFSNEEQIAEKFNSWLFESIYTVFSEKSFYNNTENIKSWVTEKNHMRRDMGQESKHDKSYTRFIICSNKESAYKFSKTERRMFVLSVSEKMVGNHGYFTRVGQAVNSASVIDHFARFFSTLDISDFNPFDIPKSEKKKELIGNEKPYIIKYFETIASGVDPNFTFTPCANIEPCSEGNFYKNSAARYEVLREMFNNGECFIEAKKLYDHWKNNDGRMRREGYFDFIKAVRSYYGIKKDRFNDIVDFIEYRPRKDGKRAVEHFIIIKKELDNG